MEKRMRSIRSRSEFEASSFSIIFYSFFLSFSHTPSLSPESTFLSLSPSASLSVAFDALSSHSCSIFFIAL